MSLQDFCVEFTIFDSENLCCTPWTSWCLTPTWVFSAFSAFSATANPKCLHQLKVGVSGSKGWIHSVSVLFWGTDIISQRWDKITNTLSKKLTTLQKSKNNLAGATLKFDLPSSHNSKVVIKMKFFSSFSPLTLFERKHLDLWFSVGFADNSCKAVSGIWVSQCLGFDF